MVLRTVSRPSSPPTYFYTAYLKLVVTTNGITKIARKADGFFFENEMVILRP